MQFRSVLKMRHLGSRRTLILVVTVSTVTVLAIASIALATGGGGAGSTGPSRLAQMSATGHSLSFHRLTQRDVKVLRRSGAKTATGGISEVAARSGFAFYTVPSVSGGTCYAFGRPKTSVAIDFIACPETSASFPFPSNSAPIFDMSLFAIDPDMQTATAGLLAGFAADGVAKVAAMGTDGRVLATAAVQNNVYVLLHPTDAVVSAIAAFDALGSDVYEKPITPSS
jgi:hypothetical protein